MDLTVDPDDPEGVLGRHFPAGIGWRRVRVKVRAQAGTEGDGEAMGAGEERVKNGRFSAHS